jgi:hypothetical protein
MVVVLTQANEAFKTMALWLTQQHDASVRARAHHQDGLTSVPTCRDARCNGTPFISAARIVPSALKYRHAQYASIL